MSDPADRMPKDVALFCMGLASVVNKAIGDIRMMAGEHLGDHPLRKRLSEAHETTWDIESLCRKAGRRDDRKNQD